MKHKNSTYRNIDIQIQDLLLILICLLLFLNRVSPIDYSSIWKYSVLCIVYICMRATPRRYYNIPLYILMLWGIIETTITILQKYHWLESNHHNFIVTGTFGNPGPLGGLLAVCWLVTIYYVFKSICNKSYISMLLLSCIASWLLYGLILSESRAAWLATFVGSMFMLYFKLKAFFVKTKPLQLKACVLLFIGIFVIIIYFMKRDSADGRLLIWYNTINIIIDYPILGIGTGGWLANYMYYQADYFIHNPSSTYAILADNVYYPYNEFLHLTAEQGGIGLLLIAFLLYFLFSNSKQKDNDINRLLKTILLAFLVFSSFSYPADVFPLNILFICIIGIIRSRVIKQIQIPCNKAYLVGSLFFIAIIYISVWSYYQHYMISKQISIIAKNEITYKSYQDLEELYPLFCYNPQLMDIYWQICLSQYSLDKKIQILQSTISIAPTCELYYTLGDLWTQKKEPTKAKKCYQTAIAMIPHRLLPQYKLFRFYVEQGNRKAALKTGSILLKQHVKKEGTKSLRIKSEVSKYLQDTHGK